MDKDRLLRKLVAVFLGELEEHVRAFNRDLLALEKGVSEEARVELYRTLFRTAHSLKGAARAVSAPLIESACHRLEEIFGAARDGKVGLDHKLYQLLFDTVDAIQDAGRRLRQGEDMTAGPLAGQLALLDAATAGPVAPPPADLAPREGPPPGEASGEGGGATAGAPSGAARGGDGHVRVPAERLEALLAWSGELLVARRRAEARGEEVARLQELTRSCLGEWRGVEKVALKLLGPNGGRAPAASSQRHTARKSARRAASALSRTGENLKRLTRRIDGLAAGLSADHAGLEQAAAPLDREIRRVRMQPFADACEGLDRMVRDLAKAQGKDAELMVEGGEIEIDRSILEGMKDPLLHLVRNAIDHGIEPGEARREAGKPARGRITVATRLSGGRVEIAVADDGRGLDLAAIRDRARERGLPEPGDEREAAGLVFTHGLSTSTRVTELSGRGVGLDVVKARVEALRGSVDITSQAGTGTRFVVIVPLTQTILRALLLRAGDQTYALDDANIAALWRAGPDDLHLVEGREVVMLDGAPVPVVSLAELLGGAAAKRRQGEARAPLVVIGRGERRVALAVDELIAEQEVLVKSLGHRVRRVRYVLGATILPDGRVTLILNAAELLRGALGLEPKSRLAASFAAPETVTKKHVVLAEDSVTTRTLVKSILEAAGYHVSTAADGAEAWRLLQQSGADLVVSDIEMPGMDGFDLTEAIRASKRFRDLPVVLVTALEGENEKARGMEVGADAYLVKSAFDQTSLLDTIARLL